jgi:hypothetical protein
MMRKEVSTSFLQDCGKIEKFRDGKGRRVDRERRNRTVRRRKNPARSAKIIRKE